MSSLHSNAGNALILHCCLQAVRAQTQPDGSEMPPQTPPSPTLNPMCAALAARLHGAAAVATLALLLALAPVCHAGLPIYFSAIGQYSTAINSAHHVRLWAAKAS